MALPMNDHFPWVATGWLWRARVNLNSGFPMYTCYGCKEDRLAFQPGSSRWHAFALPLLALDTSKSIAFFWRTITPQMRARIRDSMNSHQALDSNDFNWNTWHVRGHSRTSWQHDTTKDLEELPLARATSTCGSSIRELELSAVVVVVVVAMCLLLYH